LKYLKYFFLTSVHTFTIFVVNKITLEVKLTQRQKDILKFISDFISTNGFPPSYREIGHHFNITSTFGVKRHLDALIKKGFINVDSKSNRSISLTEKSLELFQSFKDNNSVEIPIIGRVAAGYPVLSEQNIDGTIFIDSSLIKRGGNYFGLKVRGDSMIEDGIFEGDTVIVKSQNEAFNNDIVIAMVDNDTTVKRYKKNKSNIELIPANKNYESIMVSSKDEFSLLGKVVGVYRTYN
jgi:repressor LexA